VLKLVFISALALTNQLWLSKH